MSGAALRMKLRQAFRAPRARALSWRDRRDAALLHFVANERTWRVGCTVDWHEVAWRMARTLGWRGEVQEDEG